MMFGAVYLCEEELFGVAIKSLWQSRIIVKVWCD